MSEVEKQLQELLDDQQRSRTVSMRELNQQTRGVIDRVQSEGVALTITDRGKPVAEIRPVGQKTGIDRLEELGLVMKRGIPMEINWEPVEVEGYSLAQFLEDRGDDRIDAAIARAQEWAARGAGRTGAADKASMDQ